MKRYSIIKIRVDFSEIRFGLESSIKGSSNCGECMCMEKINFIVGKCRWQEQRTMNGICA